MSGYETVVYHIRGWWSVLNALMEGFWVLVHNGYIVRRAALAFSGYWSYKIILWAGAFITTAQASGMSGTEISAIIAAIGTPMGLFQGAIFKFYSDGRRGAKNVDTSS